MGAAEGWSWWLTLTEFWKITKVILISLPTVPPSPFRFPSLSSPFCHRYFLKVHVRNRGRRWRGGNGGRCYVWRCVCVCVCTCVPVKGTGALAVSEKTAGSIWGRLIGQLGTVSMWHAAVNLLSFFHCLSPSLSFTLILKWLRLYHYPICLFQYLIHFFFLPFNLFPLLHLPIVYFAFLPNMHLTVSYPSKNSLPLFCHFQYTSFYHFHCPSSPHTSEYPLL